MGNREIDAREGSLVWVRRRNGSWWPGRIMGMHEVSDTCSVSPRSGTPVKLLGHHHSTVDWYNLEKSKRVKGFRCGEYDEWIEKAKVSAANLSKKALKYARREDAILHALQLESKAVSHTELSDSLADSNSAPMLPLSGLLSYEEPSQNGSSKVHSMQTRRKRTPNDSEDDGTEGAKRMRGLEDLGIGVVSKRKIQGAAATPEIVHQDNVSLNIFSNMGKCLENGTYVSGGKDHCLTLKRKRSQVANVHETLRRKNRRRQLTKVLESTVAMVSVPIICDQLLSSRSSRPCGLTNNKAPQFDSNESKRSDSPAIHNSDNSVACENGTSIYIEDSGCDASQISYIVKDNEAYGIPGLIGDASSNKLVDVSFVRVIGEEKHTAGI
ncbi:putative PWWP domain-containing protein [Lupinus albus]|uniref:Putative PWWP domain-containing protein n=1 Tax=Lupinus albus TaxID=3870 RepID=A0A6A4PG05_LUPAL|nr:putative PWWP domain-containing protein [Lupinus albus]